MGSSTINGRKSRLKRQLTRNVFQRIVHVKGLDYTSAYKAVRRNELTVVSSRYQIYVEDFMLRMEKGRGKRNDARKVKLTDVYEAQWKAGRLTTVSPEAAEKRLKADLAELRLNIKKMESHSTPKEQLRTNAVEMGR